MARGEGEVVIFASLIPFANRLFKFGGKISQASTVNLGYLMREKSGRRLLSEGSASS